MSVPSSAALTPGILTDFGIEITVELETSVELLVGSSELEVLVSAVELESTSEELISSSELEMGNSSALDVMLLASDEAVAVDSGNALVDNPATMASQSVALSVSIAAVVLSSAVLCAVVSVVLVASMSIISSRAVIADVDSVDHDSGSVASCCSSWTDSNCW